mgnify:CR=1 FL=1
MPEKVAGPLPPVVLNTLLVGLSSPMRRLGLTAAFPATWAINGLTVGAGEAIACYGLGMLLLWQLPKIPYFRDHGCR